jgi:hypothetical protein
MRTGLALVGIAIAGLLAAGMNAAAPAYASSSTSAYVIGGTGYQYIESCFSPGTCNSVTAGTLEIQFARTGNFNQPALGVYYQIINGTAVDGTDFSTPTTGEAIIPAGQIVTDLTVPLVNEQQFGTSKTFTVEITGTTYPSTISTGTATNTILGGNVPMDCSFTYISGTSQSLTCTQRPATQVWNFRATCKADMIPFAPKNGTQVTGDGTSTLTDCTDQSNDLFIINS